MYKLEVILIRLGRNKIIKISIIEDNSPNIKRKKHEIFKGYNVDSSFILLKQNIYVAYAEKCHMEKKDTMKLRIKAMNQ